MELPATWPSCPSLPRAACRGAPEPLWDDWVTSADGVGWERDVDREDRHELARAICGRCPEMVACLRARRDDPTLPPGIWGGCWVGQPPRTSGAHRRSDLSAANTHKGVA